MVGLVDLISTILVNKIWLKLVGTANILFLYCSKRQLKCLIIAWLIVNDSKWFKYPKGTGNDLAGDGWWWSVTFYTLWLSKSIIFATAWHCLPLFIVTSMSLRIRLWKEFITRELDWLETQNIVERLFCWPRFNFGSFEAKIDRGRTLN